MPRCWVGYPKATGPTVLPGCPHSLPHAPPRMPRYSVRAPFSLQTPVERSERVAGCWAVRARANPLSLGVWHFTLRFVLPRSWVGYPRRRPKGCGMQSPSGPKVYPKGRSGGGRGWQQSPSDCILRSVLPLCRLRSDVSGPPSLTPWVSVVARQTPPRPCLCQWVRMAEGRVSRLLRSPASLGSLSATREHHLAAEA